LTSAFVATGSSTGVFEFALQQHASELTVAKEGPARYKTD